MRRAKQIWAIIMIIACLTASGCEIVDGNTGTTVQVTVTPKPTPTPIITEPPKTQTPTPTPEPDLSANASLGFVGDIMIMQIQVRVAKNDNGYDFTRSFEPMRKYFNSVDLMLGNLETPLAGINNGGYSGPAPTKPPATEDNPNPKRPYQTFNAPDELAYNLKELGFDVLTTANNHCLDRGKSGLVRTIDVLKEAGLYQTGTFKSEEDANTPLIIDVNGIKIGIVAFSAGFNEADRKLDEQYMISKLYDYETVELRIKQAREAGAEFIVVEPHCGTELSHTPEPRHVKLFKQLAEWGADAVISSHPHVVQPMEWIEVERDNEIKRIPIVYSLGNFISNMAPSPKDYGLFVRLDIERDKDGNVTAKDLKYLPVYCIRQGTRAGMLHQTLPCESELYNDIAYEKLSNSEMKAYKKARTFVIDMCGKEYLMDDVA